MGTLFHNRKIGLPKALKSTVQLLFVGRLMSSRNVPLILYALNEWVYTFEIEDVHLTIVGTGPEKNDLSHLAHTLRIAELLLGTKI